MTKILLVVGTCMSVCLPAYAAPQHGNGAYDVAQVVPEGATGGRSGGPNQSQAVVPSGATGGRSGGPNQSQFIKKSHAKKKKAHH